MTWRTHALTGVNSLWLLTVLPHGVIPSNIALLSGIAAAGALLPDLDAAESKLKHLRLGNVSPFALLSTPLHQALGHRGLLHSLIGLGVLAYLALPLTFWWSWQPSVALVLGYASHLAADACTPHGIPLFYPSPDRFRLPPRHLRIVTGSLAEEALLPFLVAAAALLLMTHLPIAQLI